MKKHNILSTILICIILLLGCSNEFEDNVISDEWKYKYIETISMDTELGDPYTNNYRLVDIDGIQPPELYVNSCCEAAGAKILSYYKNSVIEQHLSRLNGLIYEPGTGTFINENGNMEYYKDDIYILKNGKFQNIHNGEFNCGDAEGKGPIFDEDTGEIIYYYYWDGKEVLSEEYKNNLSEYVKNPQSISEEKAYTLDEIKYIIENY